MAESRLSRFQTAGKAKLPDAVFFFLIIKHPTLLLLEVLTRKEGKHLGFMEAVSFVGDGLMRLILRTQYFTVFSVCSTHCVICPHASCVLPTFWAVLREQM